MIVATVQESGVGERIIFEILESEGIENFEEVTSFIDRLKAFGCRFSIDDFGTGYSNFIYLLKLNVDYLKIDGSLIQKLAHDENVRKAVTTIHSFAHSIGIQTVAEFVSDEAIYAEVKEIGIDYCQGYYFSEPLKVVKPQGTLL
jgi:EAL domain-containing protein (putative c-di-GMP-specific phosphodiesterase class I)